MVRIRLFFRPGKNGLAFGSWLLILASCFLAQQVFAQKIYMFCEGDYRDDSLRYDVEGANHLIRGIVDSNMPTETYLVHYNDPDADGFSGGWTGPDIRSSENVYDDILDAIESCPAGKDDTIFFYWTGHGAHDDQGHYLFMPKGKGRPTMYRSEILDALNKKRPRLVVFITDSCNVSIPLALPCDDGTRTSIFQQLLTDGVPLLYANLFFLYEGVLDMNSSSPNQEAHIDVNHLPGKMGGTVFACVVSDILENKRLEAYSWETFVQQINSDPLSRRYHQQAYVWQYPKKRDSYSIADSAITRTGTLEIIRSNPMRGESRTRRPYRRGDKLGLLSSGGDWSGGGGWGGWSTDGGGGWTNGGGSGRYMPEPGDRIVEVNSVPVHNTAEFSREVKGSPTEITLRVYETRKGVYCYLRTNLLPPGSRSRLGIGVDDDGGPGVVVRYARRGMPGTSCEYIPDDSSGGWDSGSGGFVSGGDVGDDGWSRCRYMPEIGDRIIEVNGESVNSEAEYRRAVKNSPTTITLTVIELRNQKRAYLRTELLPSNRRTRLGINAITSDLGGVVVNYVVPGSPGMRCQYKSE